MKRIILCAAFAVAASPVLAQSVERASPARVAAERIEAAPRIDRPDRPDRPDGITRQDVAEHLRHVYERARNAVENGADPARVRAKVQEHKEHVIRRWNYSH